MMGKQEATRDFIGRITARAHGVSGAGAAGRISVGHRHLPSWVVQPSAPLARLAAEGIAVKKSTRSVGNKSKTSTKSAMRGKNAKNAASGRRNTIVFLSLLTVLSLTTLLLKAMAPAPLRPDAATTLFPSDAGDSLDAIFNMSVAVRPDRWRYIYIHQSQTQSGNAMTLGHGGEGVGDHFIVGNGNGLIDGELQISERWNRQESAMSPAGNLVVEPDCVSICIVGDLDHKPPTPMQMGRLGQLVQALQARCRIPANHIEWLNDPTATPAGIGRYFPATAFHDQIRDGSLATR